MSGSAANHALFAPLAAAGWSTSGAVDLLELGECPRRPGHCRRPTGAASPSVVMRAARDASRHGTVCPRRPTSQDSELRVAPATSIAAELGAPRGHSKNAQISSIWMCSEGTSRTASSAKDSQASPRSRRSFATVFDAADGPDAQALYEPGHDLRSLLRSQAVHVDLEVGVRVRSAGRTVSEADLVQFAGLSGDHTRLHTDAIRAWVDSGPGRRVLPRDALPAAHRARAPRAGAGVGPRRANGRLRGDAAGAVRVLVAEVGSSDRRALMHVSV